MKKNQNPCAHCTRWGCDYRQCAAYRAWFAAAWGQFQRYGHHNYWEEAPEGDKLTYVHPDVIRRYLQEGPCARCGCADVCDRPCKKYGHWWDARMAVLKYRLGS